MELYIDSESGDDGGDGSAEKPLQSVEMALKLSEKEADVTLNMAPGKYMVPVEGGKKVQEIFAIPKPPPVSSPQELFPEDSGEQKLALIFSVQTAPDVKVDELTEPITEPMGAAKGMVRVTATVWTSAKLGYRVTETRLLMNPPSSKAFCAERGREIKLEILT